MKTWLFQGNPNDYDIDAYFASRPPEVTWLVTRYAKDIELGDRVYFWRSQGKAKAVSGIIAEGIVVDRPRVRVDDANGAPFWKTQGPKGKEEKMRAAMRLVKVAKTKEVIKREWCEEDPVLRALPILAMSNATNFLIQRPLDDRIAALWSRTGRDWTREESVAGLHAYIETYGKPVSQRPGSPVSNTALLIGRAVTGVYAKVMNFRSLDPRSPGQGMSAASDTDRLVWQEFFDSASTRLDEVALEKEFQRLWGRELQEDALHAPSAAQIASNVIDEASTLESSSLEELYARYNGQSNHAERPAVRLLSSRSYDRNPLVVAIARKRAKFRCEIPDCKHPTFSTDDGSPYTEVHHIVPLGDGGPDTIQNVACLCASHHRELHLGSARNVLFEQLRLLRAADALAGQLNSSQANAMIA